MGGGEGGEKEEGEKWREERGGEWKQANTVGGKDASVHVEQLPLCWHSIIITEIFKQSTLRQNRLVTSFRGTTFLAFDDMHMTKAH